MSIKRPLPDGCEKAIDVFRAEMDEIDRRIEARRLRAGLPAADLGEALFQRAVAKKRWHQSILALCIGSERPS